VPISNRLIFDIADHRTTKDYEAFRAGLQMILRLQEHSSSSGFNRLQPAARNRFNVNQLETAGFCKFQ